MSYAQLVAALLPGYIGMCVVAWLLALKSGTQARLQPAVYALVVLYICWRFDGAAPSFHYWWYLFMALVDLVLVITARVIKAPSSRWVARLGVLAIALDMVYFDFAVGGHRLPGKLYFAGSNVLESLQVGSMLLWSGPVVPMLTRTWHFVTKRREWPWIVHRLPHRA